MSFESDQQRFHDAALVAEICEAYERDPEGTSRFVDQIDEMTGLLCVLADEFKQFADDIRRITSRRGLRLADDMPTEDSAP